MPLAVRRLMGSVLHWAQTAGVGPKGQRHLGLHPAARKMNGDLAAVVEIRDDFDGEAYRAMYTASLGETIYVLHAFQKKSKSGVATPARELELVRTRLKAARDREKRLRGSTG
jgi:phage-related protein